MFYVYLHLRLDTGEIFYVGKGQKKRAYSSRNRNRHWTGIVSKYGRSVHIHSRWENETEAFSEEVRLITGFRAAGVKLVNLTDGGEGASGKPMTDEQKRQVSLVHKGKTLTPEHIASIKRALKGRVSPNKGNKYSEETRLKISLRNRGENNPNYGRIHPGLNKGTSNPMWGKPSPRRRITDEQVLNIERSREKQRLLAAQYGCSVGLVKLIKAHKARPYLWK